MAYSVMLEIAEVTTAEDFKITHNLFVEYASSLGISLDFQDFKHELAGLPGDYAPPEGRLLLARWNGKDAGCGGLRKFSDGICEMKRLYTIPQFRGLGIGRTLCEKLITAACEAGYTSMRLDTLPHIKAARALYASLGFQQIDAYRYNPIEGAVFMELTLANK